MANQGNHRGGAFPSVLSNRQRKEDQPEFFCGFECKDDLKPEEFLLKSKAHAHRRNCHSDDGPASE
jgi:hypothetical protein